MASRATSPAGAAQDVPTYAGGAEGQIGPPMLPGNEEAHGKPIAPTGTKARPMGAKLGGSNKG